MSFRARTAAVLTAVLVAGPAVLIAPAAFAGPPTAGPASGPPPVAPPAVTRAEGPLESEVDRMIADSRLLNTYMRCFLDTGPCTPEGRELKAVLPDALRTGCASCTPDQAKATSKLIDYLRRHRPDLWLLLEAKYLPDAAPTWAS
ncbi:hypothetical protein EF912_21705 [Streptomyces sp. WAC07061]|uniref:A10/OS-D family protein n=1 Tax=Streptomyces sp. WAC07061 TaxID=2487410 RepID=UPI000F77AF63|nr:A10/OS-D family protein [Streptomyces sp. WAC07061]RSS50667.1 hypothetical protein EF912_21705 [Streptomyces sp. WAC07061]